LYLDGIKKCAEVSQSDPTTAKQVFECAINVSFIVVVVVNLKFVF